MRGGYTVPAESAQTIPQGSDGRRPHGRLDGAAAPENNDAPNGSANAITTLAGAMLRAERQRVKLGT